MTRIIMHRRWASWWLALATVGVLVTAGCQNPELERSNAPPQGYSAAENPLQEGPIHMVDNALLEDMNMSSVHFVPRTSELNSLGVRRLMRLGEILKIYGGTLNYDGTEPNHDFRQARIEQIRTFLLASGLQRDEFDVQEGMAFGKGMVGSEAVEIRRATRGPGDIEVASKYTEIGTSN